MPYNIPKITRKEAEKIRDEIVWLLYETKAQNLEFSLREVCNECVINYNWVKEWSLKYPEWKDLFEYLDKEIEVPRFEVDKNRGNVGLNIPT